MILLKAEPTPAQAKAGNYKMTHRKWRGLEITVETRRGEIRRGTGRNGRGWAIEMPADYGYFKRTKGADKEGIDCFIGTDPGAQFVYVVHQRKAGERGGVINFDEDKCFLDFPSKRDALECYRAAYNNPHFMGEVSVWPAEAFVEELRWRQGRKVLLFSHVRLHEA
jgi:hypothetical protein